MFPEVVLPRTSQRTLTHAGADYHLSIAWPDVQPPAAGYPVVYLLDAHVAFATMVESERARSPRQDATGVPPTVVAGLSLAGGRADRRRRTWDFTRPGLELPDFERHAGTPPPETGGAPGLLELLVDVVFPTVEQEHAIDPARRLLFGHSLGGLFALETLFDRPGLFRAVVAASPSVWWDAPGVLARAAALAAAPPDPAPHVLVTAGEYEEELPPWLQGRPGAGEILARRRRRRMVGNVLALGEALAPLAGRGGSGRAVVYPREDHASVVLLTVNEALRIWSTSPGA